MPTHQAGKSPNPPRHANAPQRSQEPASAGAAPVVPAGSVRHVPQPLTPHDVLYLQRAIGNRAVAHMLGRGEAQRAAAWQPIEQPRHHFAAAFADEMPAAHAGSIPGAMPAANTGVISGVIQRKINQTFTQTGLPRTAANLQNFVTQYVVAELKNAQQAVKEAHLAMYAATLKDHVNAYRTRLHNATQHNYPNNWKLAVQALDALVGIINSINMESTRPGMDIYNPQNETMEWTPVPGPMSQEGVPDYWGYAPDEVLDPDEYVSFYHSTTASGNIENSAIKIMPGSKEFGEGFYTTGTDTDAPAKEIGRDWFTDKQQNPNWVIIRFSIPKKYATFLQSPVAAHNQFLNYIFTHSTGYPHGGAAPNAMDLQMINAINLEGRVLIFPDNKDTPVSTTLGAKSWTDYTSNKLGGGNYELVIGPQQPLNMGNWRQYAFTGQRAIWLMNTARRFIAYKNNAQ